MSVIATIEQLEAIYGAPNDASTVKVADSVTPLYRVLIEKSPFAALATAGPEGLDCSPRGDVAGFVRIHDARTHSFQSARAAAALDDGAADHRDAVYRRGDGRDGVARA